MPDIYNLSFTIQVDLLKSSKNPIVEVLALVFTGSGYTQCLSAGGGSELPLTGDLLAILLVFSVSRVVSGAFRNHMQGLSVGWLVGCMFSYF